MAIIKKKKRFLLSLWLKLCNLIKKLEKDKKKYETEQCHYYANETLKLISLSN